jgi:phosphoglycolate phosphatase
MADFPFDIVGFDLDGTLFDTSADLTDAVNHALGLLGRPAQRRDGKADDRARREIHAPAGARGSGGCDPEVLERTYPELLAFYGDNLRRDTHAFPGLFEAMDQLEARGVKLAIVTNKSESLAVKLVTELALDHRFACVIGGDTMGPDNRKPSPEGSAR